MQAPKKQKIVHLHGVLTISGSGMQKVMLCIYVHKHPQTHKHPRSKAPERFQNANPSEFTGFRPLRHSKYHAPGRLQNADLREFTRFKPPRPSK